MDENRDVNFFYLNRENAWLDFRSSRIERLPDGALRLSALPRLDGRPPESVGSLPEPDGPAGIAIAPDGTVFYGDPETGIITEIEACDGSHRPAACIPGEGDLPGWVSAPWGVLYHRGRGTLLVADSGNNRIQAFDPRTWQVMDIWGRAGVPGALPWGLHEPWSLAGDPDGNVYVIDRQESDRTRILKFDLRGVPQPEFSRAVDEDGAITNPIAVASGILAGKTRIYVLDAASKSVVVIEPNGRALARFGAGKLDRPLVLAAGNDAVYVGDNGHRQVLVFKPVMHETEKLEFHGFAAGYRGPVAALEADAVGDLWLLPGSSGPPLKFSASEGFARSGVLLGGPFGYNGRGLRWHRLKADLDTGGDDTGIQFFVFGSDDPATAPHLPEADAEVPFTDLAGWRALPLNASDALVPPPPRIAPPRSSLPVSPNLAGISADLNAIPKEPYLWVGVHLTSEGSTTPVLRQIRLEYDQTTYRQHLPAIFSRDLAQADLLDRLLSLYESFFEEAEDQIRDLVTLFDPDAAPKEWLNWLAGWLGLELDETWTEDLQRQAIRLALERYNRRGTALGLREMARSQLGIDIHIDEPVLATDWWALAPDDPDDAPGQSVSVLGFTTRLAPAQAEGAVLGSTAVLDGSNLIGADERGVPLFSDVAHQFTVQVYRGQVGGERDQERVRSLIDRERPIHTMYHLCVIEARMRVGRQSRLGVDTVVAGPLQPSPLDASGTQEGLILGGEPPGQMGIHSEVGRSARLTTGSLE